MSHEHEQVPTVVIVRLDTGKTTIPGVGVGSPQLGIDWLGLGLSLAK